MKAFYVLVALVLAVPAHSQSLLQFPNVQTDRRVTFRLKAPHAKDVQVECESLQSAKMEKDDLGIWWFTTDPLEPDYYGYHFVVDGVRIIDLGNPLMKYNLLYTDSEFHVPGPASLPWEVSYVPHGVVHRHFYKSLVGGDDRAYYVYTPPGYKASGRKRYPVLYLLHGFSDDASAWCSVGRANIIMDNLIARGKAKPMIVVMPLGYGSMDILQHGLTGVFDPEQEQWNVDQFCVTLLDEVMPQVEKDYHVSTDRKDRAIAGLSMGGAESLDAGLNNLDRFAWIGSFSCGGAHANFATQFPHLDARVNDRLRLLWISCGKDDDKWLPPNREFVNWLKSKDIHCTWKEVPGAHSWKVWRRNLADFLPLLFK